MMVSHAIANTARNRATFTHILLKTSASSVKDKPAKRKPDVIEREISAALGWRGKSSWENLASTRVWKMARWLQPNFVGPLLRVLVHHDYL